MKLFFSALILFSLFLSACSTKEPHARLTPYKLHNNHDLVTKLLYKEYKKWYHTPYKYGGTSSCGIDCSAIVQRIYKDAFGMKIPRTTAQQKHIGILVRNRAFHAGDILLFKTSYNTLHSAIYLERGNFIHASSKYGVTLSNIHNPYWRANYLEARRVLP